MGNEGFDGHTIQMFIQHPQNWKQNSVF